jgi:hypothetical protein
MDVMGPSLWSRIRALFGAGDSTLELVMFGNAFAALGIGVAALLEWELTVLGAAGVAVGTFGFLTACLLFRYTLWIPALVGGATVTVSPTLLLAGLGMRIHPAGAWAGGVLGLLLGLGFAFRGYIQVGRLARLSVRDPERVPLPPR